MGSAADVLVVQRLSYPWRPLGDVLVQRGLIEAGHLEQALDEQRRAGGLLGEILVASGAISTSDLISALAEQCGLEVELESTQVLGPEGGGRTSRSWRPLGQVLVERGALTRSQLREALAEQSRGGRRLGEVLVEHGFVSGSEVISAVMEQHGLGQPDGELAVVRPLRQPAESDSEPQAGSAEAYEVHMLDRSGHIRTLLFSTESFLDATDFAFEILAAEEPHKLEIVHCGGDGPSEVVWVYDAQEAAKIAAQARDSVDVFGFDVTSWTGPPPHEP